jgi:hypothetical protein
VEVPAITYVVESLRTETLWRGKRPVLLAASNVGLEFVARWIPGGPIVRENLAGL